MSAEPETMKAKPAEVVDEAAMAAALRRISGRIVLCGHEHPDGDAIGATFGLCHALRASGRDAVCWGVAPIPRMYSYLEEDALPGMNVPLEAFEPTPGDTIIVLDCGVEDRVYPPIRPWLSRCPVLCIDHHKSSTGLQGPFLLEPEAGSVSHAPQGEGVKSPALKGECCDLFAQGLNGNGLVHNCVEVIHSHGGQDAVNGIFQRGVALHHGHADVDTAVATLKAGALDFLQKPVDTIALVKAIEPAVRISFAKASGRLSPRQVSDILHDLSPREKEITQLLLLGITNKEIAERLDLSQRTVHGHRNNIYHKLRVHNLQEFLHCVKSADSSI